MCSWAQDRSIAKDGQPGTCPPSCPAPGTAHVSTTKQSTGRPQAHPRQRAPAGQTDTARSATWGSPHAQAPCLSSARTTKHLRTRAADPPLGSPEHTGTPAGRRGLSSTPSRQQCWPHAETTAAEAAAEKRSLSSAGPSAGREHARAGLGTAALPPPASGGAAAPRLWSHHSNLCLAATSLLCVQADTYTHMGVHARGVCTPVFYVSPSPMRTPASPHWDLTSAAKAPHRLQLGGPPGGTAPPRQVTCQACSRAHHPAPAAFLQV